LYLHCISIISHCIHHSYTYFITWISVIRSHGSGHSPAETFNAVPMLVLCLLDCKDSMLHVAAALDTIDGLLISSLWPHCITIMFPHYVLIVSTLGLIICPRCIPIVSTLYSHCIYIVFSLYLHWDLLYSHCIYIVTYYILLVSTLYPHFIIWIHDTGAAWVWAQPSRDSQCCSHARLLLA
jgi:hypothetical protein